MNPWKYELTDTFGGQPNYSWVERGQVLGSQIEALRWVRKKFGLLDRAQITRSGDTLELRWPSYNIVLFFEPAND